MKRAIVLIVLAGLGIGGAVALVSPAWAGGTCHDAVSNVARTTTVEMSKLCFRPHITHLRLGEEVTFVNRDPVTHNVIGLGMRWGIDDLRPNRSASHRFDEEGIYPYACYVHPGMVGALVVGDEGAASGGSSDRVPLDTEGVKGPGLALPATLLVALVAVVVALIRFRTPLQRLWLRISL